MGVPLVSNELESAENLTNCEETQKLSANNSSSSKLSGAEGSSPLEEACWVGALGNESVRVSDALDESLEIGLEGRDRAICKLVKRILSRS